MSNIAINTTHVLFQDGWKNILLSQALSIIIDSKKGKKQTIKPWGERFLGNRNWSDAKVSSNRKFTKYK